MSLESELNALLSPLAPGRTFPDVLPDNFNVFEAAGPVIIWQQAGGNAGWYVEKVMPSHKHARVMVHVWGQDRDAVSALIREVERAFCESTMATEPYGAADSLYDDAGKLYGSRQFFGMWYPDP